MIHVSCRLTAKNCDQLRNPTLGNGVWATFTFVQVYEPGLWTWQDVLESDHLKLSPVTAKQMWISDQVAGVEVDGLVAYYLIWQM